MSSLWGDSSGILFSLNRKITVLTPGDASLFCGAGLLSVQFNRSVMSDFLQPMEGRIPCPSLTPGKGLLWCKVIKTLSHGKKVLS